jgi:putative heme-binding domain-containing protein
LGYSSNPLGAQELAILSRSDDPWLRAAVLTSAPEHPDEILKSLLAATINTPGRTEMIASLIATAAGLDQRSSLENIIVAIAPPPGRVESWHFDALGSWFEAISRKGITAQSLLATDRQRVREAKANLNSAVTTAQAIVANPTIDEAAREAAIRFLGVQTQQPDAFDQLRVLLKSALSLRLRNAVLSTMRRRHGTDVAIALLADWAIYSPSLRSDVIGLLLTRDEWTRELLGAVERDSVVTSEIPSTIRQQLLKHKDTEIQQRAVKLFQKVSTRSQVLAHYANIAVLIGAADHGAAVFDKNCAQCHAYRGHGHAVGPNLMEFAGKSVQDFLVAILDPNAAINPNFLAYNIDTKDGRSLTGIVRGETASGLTLVQGGGVEEKILRGDIKEIRASQLSLMPEGLEQGMTPQDGADLIAWLKQSYFRVDSPLPSSK